MGSQYGFHEAIHGRPAPDAEGESGTAEARWNRLPIARIEDLKDAVLGAGLEATQMTHTPVIGSLLFMQQGGVTYSSGLIQGRVALRGPLSQDLLTIGVCLRLPPGCKHWLTDVATGEAGVFHAGDDHDALYAPGALYVTASLTPEKLEEEAAGLGLVLDRERLGGTGLYGRRIPAAALEPAETALQGIHDGTAVADERLGERVLHLLVRHFARAPRPGQGRPDPHGYARIVARAREYIHAHLHEPIAVAAVTGACATSRRTLFRAFADVLGETPHAYVTRVRLHRIRHDLASEEERVCSIAQVANRWGVSELGRLSSTYRALFQELPSETLARRGESKMARIA